MSLNPKSLAKNKVQHVHNILRVTDEANCPWNLTPEIELRIMDTLEAVYHHQHGKCALTGVPLDNAYTGRYWGNRILVGKKDDAKIFTIDNLMYYMRTETSKRKKGGKYSREFLQFCVDYVNKQGGTASMPDVARPSDRELRTLSDRLFPCVNPSQYDVHGTPIASTAGPLAPEPTEDHRGPLCKHGTPMTHDCLACDEEKGTPYSTQASPTPTSDEDGGPLPF